MSKPVLAAMLSCAGLTLSDAEKRLFSKANPLGIILFARNLQNTAQVKHLTEEIKNVINRDDVLIAIDQEGGRVSRLNKVSRQHYASAEILGRSESYFSSIHAVLIADKMRRLGINVNFAPVIEKITEKMGKVLESRCFSADSKKVTACAAAMADSYIKNAVCPCIKHLPGHFSAQEDPHLSQLQTNLSTAELEKETEYLKFFKKYPLAMTSHIRLNAFDTQNPVTLSKKCISEFLRGFLEYDGLLISDAIDMHALTGSIEEKMQNSLNAGVDVISYCAGKYEDLYNICQTKRFMTEKTLIRFAKIKKIIHNIPEKVNISVLKKLYRQEFGEGLNKKYAYDATEILHQMLKKGENV